MFKLIDGVLYRQKPGQDTGDWLLAIPESLRESVLSLHHDLQLDIRVSVALSQD